MASGLQNAVMAEIRKLMEQVQLNGYGKDDDFDMQSFLEDMSESQEALEMLGDTDDSN